jgi:hypothetical protein
MYTGKLFKTAPYFTKIRIKNRQIKNGEIYIV